MPRITLLLDFPRKALKAEGWGMGKVAGALQFAARVQEGDKTRVRQTSLPKGFWKVPTVGCITLAPIFETEGTLLASDPFAHFWDKTEVNIANNDDGSPALSPLEANGTWTRSRPGPTATALSIASTVADLEVLFQISASLRKVWETKNSLAANEGFQALIQPIRVYNDNKSKGYIAFTFGRKYALSVDLQGAARLYENVGSDSVPNWLARKNMDLASVGVSLKDYFSIQVIPIAGRYLVMRFGNTRFGGGGIRLDAYQQYRDFLFDCVEEGGGNSYDSAIEQYVVTPAGKLGISIINAGTDYRITPFKLRYPTDKTYTALLTAEPLPNLLPGQTPELEPRGYASGFTQGGAGTLSLNVEGEGSSTYDSTTDRMVVPKLSMAADPSGIWTPELWYIDGRAKAQTAMPLREAYDASKEWYSIRIQKADGFDRCRIELKLKEDARYLQLYRRGGPVRVLVDDEPIFDGYIDVREPVVGIAMTEAEYSGEDMKARLRVFCGQYETLDGKLIGDIIRQLLQRAGFDDDQIEIQNENLAGMTFSNFDKPQTVKLFTNGTTVENALQHIIDHYCVQGADFIRVHWTGEKWEVSLGENWYDPTRPDPETIFYTNRGILTYFGASGYDDEERWAAGLFKVTSDLEPHSHSPEFNALRAYSSNADDFAPGNNIIIAPDPAVNDDPTDQAYEGLLRCAEFGPPKIHSTTHAELAIEARCIYGAEQRKSPGFGFQGEYQPSVKEGKECVLVGLNPQTKQPFSYGVFLITEIDAEISLDDVKDPDGEIDPETGEVKVLVRAWEWTSSYTIRFLRATSSDFPLPMFSTILPKLRILVS